MPTRATNQIIDIGNVARPFRFVRLANYFMVVGCGTWLVGQIVSGPSVPRDWLPLSIALWTALAVNFWAGLKTAGTIDLQLWRRLYWSLPLLAVTGGASAISFYGSLPPDIHADTNPAGNATFVALVIASIMGLSGLVALVAVVVLDRARIAVLSMRLRELLAAVETSKAAPTGPVRAEPVNAVKGVLYFALAAVVLIGQHFVPDEVWSPNAQLLSLIGLSGWAFLFHGRRYFQPSATLLLEVDKGRKPILLLRSFEDDERFSYLRSELSVVDFGLETRLAAQFLRFGPFVAIGSPKDPTPRPGVATALLDDKDWQAVVQDWIERAQYIVLLAGTTRWVNWELEQVVKRGQDGKPGQDGKLILMLPRAAGWLGFGRRRAAAARLAKITEVFGKEAPERAPIEAPRPQDIRAIVLRPDGTFSIITSRPRNRDSYHVAAIVGQYLLMQQSNLAS